MATIIKCDICGNDEGIVTLVGYEIDMCGSVHIHPTLKSDLCMRCSVAVKEAIKDTITGLVEEQPKLCLEYKKKRHGGRNG